MLDKVVHNLTHRRFKDTSRASVYQLGSSVANSFFDARNVGNFEAGEIAPEGRYLTHYPVNAGSNTAGFSIMDDAGDDRRGYYPSQVYSGKNALVLGGGSGSSNGSASDYVYFNPSYEALLNPKSNKTMTEIAQPHYLPINSLAESEIKGRGTNAPSSASAVDYAMNNPYAFKSNFNGGSLGAASSGSASDYYDSNPNRVPAMQSETRHFTDFMEGGEINWSKYLGYIRKGAETVAKHAPKIIEHAPKVIETIKTVRDVARDVNKEKGALNKLGAVVKSAPKLYEGAKSSLETIKELRGVLKNNRNGRSYSQMVEPPKSKSRKMVDEEEYKPRESKKSAPQKQYKFMTRADYEKQNKAPAYRDTRVAPAYRDTRVAPAYEEREAPEYYEGEYDELPASSSQNENIVMKVNEVAKKKAGRPRKEKVEKPKGKVGRPKKEKVVKPKGKVGRPSKAMRTMQIDV